MSLRKYDGSFTTAGVVIGLLAFAAMFLSIWAFFDALFGTTYSADGYNTHCLTKEQARTKWPKELIYWHTAHHCWDNVQGTANTASMADGTVKIIRAPKPNRTIKAGREDMPAPPIDASGNAVRTR